VSCARAGTKVDTSATAAAAAVIFRIRFLHPIDVMKPNEIKKVAAI
jgi:hypothetical protein